MRVIQVGYGYWGANVARKIIESPKFELVALCEGFEERAAKARAALPDTTIIDSDYSRYLEDPSVEAFVICTQTEYSFEIAMRAMDAGKHVFTEKPFATTVERALRLREKAYEKNVIIHCDHIMLYNPYFRYIKKMIDEGELGDLMYIDVERLNLGPIRKDINALLDLAVHDIAVIDWITGGKSPISMSAYGHTPFGRQDVLTFLTLKYDSLIANIKSSWVSPNKVRQTVISGTKKMVIFDDMSPDRKVTVYDCGIDVVPAEEYKDYAFLNRRGDIYIPNIEFEDSLRNSLEFFENCVRTGTQSLSGPEQSLRVMYILEEAQKQLGR